MAPWWKHHKSELQPCERCKAVAVLHEGLCKRCRREEAVEESRPDTRPAASKAHTDPDLEPAHDRPWVHRGGG